MKKLILGSVVLATLFFVSCKKENVSKKQDIVTDNITMNIEKNEDKFSTLSEEQKNQINNYKNIFQNFTKNSKNVFIESKFAITKLNEEAFQNEKMSDRDKSIYFPSFEEYVNVFANGNQLSEEGRAYLQALYNLHKDGENYNELINYYSPDEFLQFVEKAQNSTKAEDIFFISTNKNKAVSCEWCKPAWEATKTWIVETATWIKENGDVIIDAIRKVKEIVDTINLFTK
jgi:hypothetical protein